MDLLCVYAYLSVLGWDLLCVCAVDLFIGLLRGSLSFGLGTSISGSFGVCTVLKIYGFSCS